MTQRAIHQIYENEMKKSHPKILHHGKCLGVFKPKYIGTDYFGFMCSCGQEAWVHTVLLDNRGRFIFNLKCLNCGEEDALKIAIKSKTSKIKYEEGLSNILISPHHDLNIKRHRWDND